MGWKLRLGWSGSEYRCDFPRFRFVLPEEEIALGGLGKPACINYLTQESLSLDSKILEKNLWFEPKFAYTIVHDSCLRSSSGNAAPAVSGCSCTSRDHPRKDPLKELFERHHSPRLFVLWPGLWTWWARKVIIIRLERMAVLVLRTLGIDDGGQRYVLAVRDTCMHSEAGELNVRILQLSSGCWPKAGWEILCYRHLIFLLFALETLPYIIIISSPSATGISWTPASPWLWGSWRVNNGPSMAYQRKSSFPSSDTFLRIFSLTILKYHLCPQLKFVSSLTPHTLPESRRLLYLLAHHHRHPKVSPLARQILWLLVVVSLTLFKSLSLSHNTW